jgi:hypothetical protein
LKKIYSTSEFKERNKKNAERSLKRQIRFKIYKRKKNKSNLGLDKSQLNYKQTFEAPFKSYVKIIAPSNFSFIDNPIEVVKFISKLKDQFDNKNKVFVVLKNVEIISYDAIVVLLSILVRFKSNKIKFNGDFPKSESAKMILKESKFLEYLFQNFNAEDRYELGQNSSIVTHAWKNVDSELGDKIISNASKTVWGEERRCQGIQRTLIELMLNTNNHADDSKKGEKHWWLSVHHDKKNKKVSFAFIDFGVGVFTSLNNKRSGSKFYKIIELLKEKFTIKDNSELLKYILDGTLHKTATGKPYHGKGLPGIFKALTRNQLSNLNVITNNVHAKVDAKSYMIMPLQFSGTFVYWELNEENLNCHGRI